MAITMTSAKYGPSISFLAPHHKRSGEMPWLVMVKKQKLSNNNVFSEFKNIPQGGIYPPQQSFVWHVSCTFLVPSFRPAISIEYQNIHLDVDSTVLTSLWLISQLVKQHEVWQT